MRLCDRETAVTVVQVSVLGVQRSRQTFGVTRSCCHNTQIGPATTEPPTAANPAVLPISTEALLVCVPAARRPRPRLWFVRSIENRLGGPSHQIRVGDSVASFHDALLTR